MGVLCTTDIGDRVTGICVRRCRLQFIIGQSRTRLGYDDGVASRRVVELIAVNENAAGHTDQEYIQTNADSATHVNLEHGFAKPRTLRLRNPPFPMRHLPLSRIDSVGHYNARMAGTRFNVRAVPDKGNGGCDSILLDHAAIFRHERSAFAFSFESITLRITRMPGDRNDQYHRKFLLEWASVDTARVSVW